LNPRSPTLSTRCAPDQPDDELLAERLEHRAVRTAERMLDPVGPRRAVAIGDAHAARIVDEHADVVPLRHRRREQQHGAEETHHQHAERGDADGPQDDAISLRALAAHARVAENRGDADRGRGQQQDHDRERRAEGNVALRELSRPVLEQELKNSFQPVRHDRRGSWRSAICW
jgi:hypothetical protein